jgi:hypothetical protein
MTPPKQVWHVMEMAALVQFLGPFAKLGKANIIFAVSNCPSVLPHGETRFPLNGFLWNLVFVDFSKICYKIPVSLKSVKNSRYFTWRLMYIYDNISLSSPQNDNFSDKSCSENHSPHFLFKTGFFPKYCLVWDNVQKYGRARQATDDNKIRVMLNNKAIHTHSEYMILTPLPRQWLLCERILVYCLSYSLLSPTDLCT